MQMTNGDAASANGGWGASKVRVAASRGSRFEDFSTNNRDFLLTYFCLM
jgi:hypothetical protein